MYSNLCFSDTYSFLIFKWLDIKHGLSNVWTCGFKNLNIFFWRSCVHFSFFRIKQTRCQFGFLWYKRKILGMIDVHQYKIIPYSIRSEEIRAYKLDSYLWTRFLFYPFLFWIFFLYGPFPFFWLLFFRHLVLLSLEKKYSLLRVQFHTMNIEPDQNSKSYKTYIFSVWCNMS